MQTRPVWTFLRRRDGNTIAESLYQNIHSTFELRISSDEVFVSKSIPDLTEHSTNGLSVDEVLIWIEFDEEGWTTPKIFPDVCAAAFLA